MIKIARIGKGRRFLKIGKYNLMFRPAFVWYDLWVGAYWDRENKYLYVCPLPTICIKMAIRKTLTDSQLIQVLAKGAVEAERVEKLTDKELVTEVLNSSKGLADSSLVIGLIDRVLPGWEDIKL